MVYRTFDRCGVLMNIIQRMTESIILSNYQTEKNTVCIIKPVKFVTVMNDRNQPLPIQSALTGFWVLYSVWSIYLRNIIRRLYYCNSTKGYTNVYRPRRHLYPRANLLDWKRTGGEINHFIFTTVVNSLNCPSLR